MTAQTIISTPFSVRERNIRKVTIGVLLAALLYRAVVFAAAGFAAIRYPWSLDYGEGIVWQQIRWIFTSHAYGPIDGFPAIVFHYPPLYHAVTAIGAGALGTDQLATGRAISLVSTVAAAVASALLTSLLLQNRANRTDRRLCGWIAGLLVFTYFPVTNWAMLMRVDMLAVALSLFGLVAAFKSLERPRFIDLASLLFVAAVYTKQTALAAPAATFAVLIILRPKLAIRGIASCLVLGTATLLTLGWLTDGGFYRHLFLYNLNRADVSRLWWIAVVAMAQALYVVLAGLVLVRRLAELRSKYAGHANARAALAANAADIPLLIAIAYLATSTVMLLLVLKSGSSVNYFLEWFFALGPFAAMAQDEVKKGTPDKPERQGIPAAWLALGLTIGALMAPLPRSDYGPDTPYARGLAQLSKVIAAADKPVISDDMVLLIRGGKDVPWEPAIFAELASTGRWDERPFVRRIRNGELAFFITLGDEGQHSFGQRYNPAVAQAMDAAYPETEEIAGLIVRRPGKRP